MFDVRRCLSLELALLKPEAGMKLDDQLDEVDKIGKKTRWSASLFV